ncbi:MAG TPA: Flp pilus assembly protein CpaB [Caldilineaceae bacterium]|nr:Flp pilus assembly protein CpaB [Caldilineaceae bacterium]HRW03900.1 Flp pilus assembly protein CpaB [Caldilineaceae bacterium]
MKNSGFIWWIGALVFAGIAGVLTLSLLRQNVASSEANVNTRPVVVAVVDVPFRRSIGEGEVAIRDLPVDSIPEGAATTLDQVIGKMSTVDIYTNEPFLVQQLVTPEIVTQQVALTVPKGKIVTAVPTTSRLVSNRLVRPGDHIDLLATFEVEVMREQGGGPLPTSVGLLQDLEVYAIILPVANIDEGADAVSGRSEGGVFRTSDAEGQSILLAIDTQDALAIRHILDVGGELDLAVRAPGDDTVANVVAVDQFYLADRYNIQLVRTGASQSAPFIP